jgi:hypothetical protein
VSMMSFLGAPLRKEAKKSKEEMIANVFFI